MSYEWFKWAKYIRKLCGLKRNLYINHQNINKSMTFYFFRVMVWPNFAMDLVHHRLFLIHSHPKKSLQPKKNLRPGRREMLTSNHYIAMWTCLDLPQYLQNGPLRIEPNPFKSDTHIIRYDSSSSSRRRTVRIGRNRRRPVSCVFRYQIRETTQKSNLTTATALYKVTRSRTG